MSTAEHDRMAFDFEADATHRLNIHRAIVDALLNSGIIDPDGARMIVALIAGGELPSVKIVY